MPKALGSPRPGPARTGVFISYSHEDAAAFKSVMQHLAVVEREGHTIWTDRDIQPGQHWHDEISQALLRAKIAILIVTPAFVASDYITNHELPSLLKAAQDEGLTIFWIPWDAADTVEVNEFQAAHPPQTPLATLPRSKRQQALVAIVRKLKELLGDAKTPHSIRHQGRSGTPAQIRGGDTTQQSRRRATTIRLELTDEMTIPFDDREATVTMEEILYATQTSEVSIDVEIPELARARRELARLEVGARLTVAERERRAYLRKQFQPTPGFPRDIFLSEILTSLVRHVPQLAPAIRSGSDLLECVKESIIFRRHSGEVAFECFRQQGSWSVQFDAPTAVADAIADDRSTTVPYLHWNLVELYASEFPAEVIRGRIIPALLWYGGHGFNGASLDNPELFDLSRLRVGLA